MQREEKDYSIIGFYLNHISTTNLGLNVFFLTEINKVRPFFVRKIIPKNKVVQHIPTELIDQSMAQEWSGTLAYFILLKAKHQNQRFYNFSATIIASELKVSYNTATKIIRQLIDRNLAYLSGGNLTLVGIDKLKKRYKLKKTIENLTQVKICKNKHEQMIALRATVIQRNLQQQEFRRNRKTKTLLIAKSSCPTPKVLSTIKKAGGMEEFERSINEKIILSNRRFGILIHRSGATGKRLQKTLNEYGIIKSQRTFIKMSWNEKKLPKFIFDSLFEGKSMFYNKFDGAMYRYGANSISLKTIMQ